MKVAVVGVGPWCVGPMSRLHATYDGPTLSVVTTTPEVSLADEGYESALEAMPDDQLLCGQPALGASTLVEAVDEAVAGVVLCVDLSVENRHGSPMRDDVARFVRTFTRKLGEEHPDVGLHAVPLLPDRRASPAWYDEDFQVELSRLLSERADAVVRVDVEAIAEDPTRYDLGSDAHQWLADALGELYAWAGHDRERFERVGAVAGDAGLTLGVSETEVEYERELLVRRVPVLTDDPAAVVRRATTPDRTAAPVEAGGDDRGLAVFVGPDRVVEDGVPRTVTGDGVDLSVAPTAGVESGVVRAVAALPAASVETHLDRVLEPADLLGERTVYRAIHLPDEHTPADLGPDADLSGAALADVDVVGVSAPGADLSDADLTGADLTEATLSGADLSDADCSRATLTETTLAEATLSGADATRVDGSEVSVVGGDLSEADLSHATLSGAELAEADLTGATLADADLTDATLTGATLVDADLPEANCRETDLAEADLTRATLVGAELPWVDLTHATLAEADLSHATLGRGDLTGADLSEADLTGVDVGAATLSGADLSDATLTGAGLSGADLSGADLSGTDLSTADVSGADLSGAVFDGTDCSETDCSGADLSGSTLDGVDLSEADLSGADLSGVTCVDTDLSHATLSRADLTGADLSGADLTGVALAGADTTDAVVPEE